MAGRARKKTTSTVGITSAGKRRLLSGRPLDRAAGIIRTMVAEARRKNPRRSAGISTVERTAGTAHPANGRARRDSPSAAVRIGKGKSLVTSRTIPTHGTAARSTGAAAAAGKRGARPTSAGVTASGARPAEGLFVGGRTTEIDVRK